MKIAFLVGCLLALATSSGCVGTQECTEVGCGDAGAYVADVPRGVDDVAVEVCRNADCDSATVSIASDPSGAYLDALPAVLVLTPKENGASVEVRLMQSGKMLDGDVFSVRVTDAHTGAVIAEEKHAVSYETSYPNGADCGPACRFVTSGPFASKP